MHNWETSKYEKVIKITKEDLDWIKENKGKKSAAGFLKQILEEFKKPNLFKKKQ